MQKKTCSRCKTEKSLEEFCNNKKAKDGKRSQCKTCDKEQHDKYAAANKEKIAANRKQRYWQDPETERKNGRERYNRTKEQRKISKKAWRDKNKDKTKQIHKDWYEQNKEHKLAKNREWEKDQMENNPLFRLKKNLRTRIIDVIRGKSKKSASTMELLGCTIEEFKVYLENQFDENMTWENYGEYWHVDHIKPCSLFDLSKEEEQRKCFHHSNLQSLEASENMSKLNKYPYIKT